MNAVNIIKGYISNAAKLRILAVVTVCGMVLPLFSQAPTSRAASSLEREFQAAMAAQDKGDIEGAKTLLLGLHRKHPGIFAVDESLGLLYVAQEKYTEAVPFLQAATREQPTSSAAHANLGAAFYKIHRHQEAVAELEQAVRLDPRNLTAQTSLGQALLEDRKPDRAAEAFSAALRLKPGDDDTTHSYAAALVAGKRYDEAARALASTTSSEQSALAQSLLGEIDEAKGNFQSALQHFARAVELEPSEENVWALGVELLRHWSFGPAIREFEAAVAKFPQSTRMRFGLGAAYFGDSKYAAAVPVFADLLDTDKNNALYAELLGMGCTSVSGATESLRCSGLIDYARAHPRDAKISTYAASMLLTQTATEERTALAAKLLENALAVDPKLADAQYHYGFLLQNEGKWAASVAPLEKAIQLKPDLAQAHYRLALAYWRTGRKQEGQEQMDLQKKYAKQQKEDLDKRLRQITTFIVDVPK